MTDREKLIELLTDSFDAQCNQRQLITPVHTADHLIANGVTVQQWISVEDGMPENGVWVLAWQKCGWMGIAQIEEDGWHWYTQDLVKLEDPSHWMPLPEPPKED